MGMLDKEKELYFTDFAKFQLKSSIGWMKLVSFIGLFAAAALWFFTFEFIRHEVTRGRVHEEEILALTIFIIAGGLITAIFYFMLISASAYKEFVEDGSPSALQRAISRKKTSLILGGIFAILACIGILFLLGIYIDEVLLRRW